MKIRIHKELYVIRCYIEWFTKYKIIYMMRFFLSFFYAYYIFNDDKIDVYHILYSIFLIL